MRWLLHLLALVVLLVSTTAHADEDAAQALYEQARIAYDKGDYQTAYTLFEQSQRLDAAPGTMLNLALCSNELGRLTDAHTRVSTVIDQLPANDRRLPVAKKLRADLVERIPRVRVELTGVGAVLLDGTELSESTLSSDIMVDPGRHMLVARAVGRADAVLNFEVSERDRRTVSIAVGEPLAPPKSMPSPHEDGEAANAEPPGRWVDVGSTPEPAPPWFPAVGWASVGIGVASLSITAIMAGLIVDRDGTVDAHCDAQRQCDQAAFDAADEGKTFSAVGTATAVIGLVAGLAGATLLVVSHRRGVAEADVAQLDIVPAAGGAMAVLTFTP